MIHVPRNPSVACRGGGALENVIPNVQSPSKTPCGYLVPQPEFSVDRGDLEAPGRDTLKRQKASGHLWSEDSQDKQVVVKETLQEGGIVLSHTHNIPGQMVDCRFCPV